ncbi:hypothetical protein CL628_02870 [bacterium]|nr:hypothetical protein [bacterium]
MYLEKLALHNFRNFTHVEQIVLPKSGLLIAAAPNATGKTNFLESIVMLLRGKSFRAGHAECVQWGEDGFVVRGVVHRQAGTLTTAVHYHQPTQKVRIEEGGEPVSPVMFYQHYPMVTFLPEDTFLFTRGPAVRRNFLNRALVSVPAYVSALVQYQRSLKQRNANLKTAASFADLAAWTDVLVEHAESLWQHRRSLATFISTHLPELYQRITGEELLLVIELVTSTESAGELAENLANSFPHESRYGYTLQGPHRDDLTVTVDDRPVADFLSQGQQRSLVIALKLCAHSYIKKTINETPLFIADELLSELDEQRQEILLANLPTATQTILTTTSVPAIVKKRADAHLLDLRSILAAAEEPDDDFDDDDVDVDEHDTDTGDEEPIVAEEPVAEGAPAATA